MRGVFVTGTDTDCGKTHVARAIICLLRERGLQVAPFKPVAAGAELHDGQLRNDDALALIRAAGGDWVYQQVNPYCLRAAVSPHLAARDTGVQITLPPLLEAAQTLSEQADFLLVEGAGGWMVPLSSELDIRDLARELALPVILVVGLRLGCLNHARLSEQAILRDGAELAGWIGSQVDPHMQRLPENLQTLHARMRSPCLGVIYWQQPPQLQVERFL